MRRNKLICILLLAAMLVPLCACAAPSEAGGGTGKLQIVCSLFPQYDFAREIAGDRAELTLLLPAGVESHTYDPTPADMTKISGCDLFIYTGEYMEPWAAKLAGSAGSEAVLDASQGVELSGSHDDHGHGDGEKHSDTPDPHIWTSPLNAKIMVENIRDALIEIDPDGESEYAANAEAYLGKLDALDKRLRSAVADGKRTTLVFGGRFAFHYLAEEYGLDCHSAYDSCSEETEPSAAAVAELTNIINDENIPVVYYEELTDPKVARAIADETGAKLLMLHSCHNLSADEREAGATYLSLMEQNIDNIIEGLS